VHIALHGQSEQRPIMTDNVLEMCTLSITKTS
jgi:hypothetical protein